MLGQITKISYEQAVELMVELGSTRETVHCGTVVLYSGHTQAGEGLTVGLNIAGDSFVIRQAQ